MKAMKSKEIVGNWATLLLPINSDDSIDMVRLAEEIDILISFGPDGIYSNGTAGEFYNQTEYEFDQVSELLASHCEKAEIPFQLGVSHMSPFISRERLGRIVSLKPSAIQLILPDWVVPTIDEAIMFLQEMAQRSDGIGLVLYNPPHAKKLLTLEEIAKLKQAVPEIVGIKVCDGDQQWYQQMRTHCHDLSVFVPGHHLATGIKLGAQGSYSNMACLHPKAAGQWYHQMQEDIEGALELESRIADFMEKYIAPFIHQGYSNTALDKLLAAIGQWSPVGTRLRWPYKWIDQEHANSIRQATRNIIPEFIL